MYGNALQDPFLDLFHAVVILVQHLGSLFNVQLCLCALVPGQLQAGVQIVPDYKGFLGIRGHFRQPLRLLHQLAAAFLRQVQRLDALHIVIGIILSALILAKLGRNHLHLLPQIIVPLAPVHIFLDLLLDLTFQVEDIHFLAEIAQQHTQPHQNIILLQQLLLGGKVQIQIVCHVVKDLIGIVLAQHGSNQLLGHPGNQLAVLLKGLLHGACHSSQLGFIHLCSAIIRHPAHHASQVLALGIQRQQSGLVDTLDQHPEHIVRGFQRLAHLGDHADLIYILLSWLLGEHIPLCHQEHAPVFPERSVNCLDGRLSGNIKMHDHAWKRHQPTHGDGGQPFGFRADCQLFILFHVCYPIYRCTGTVAVSAPVQRVRKVPILLESTLIIQDFRE